ncbi:MAG: tetratricopeptide repeat protein [candidate division Zixibacteria bacterium]|nr:tetratricopeptide repeat protein [candidate division Zixibacteria bacterium]
MRRFVVPGLLLIFIYGCGTPSGDKTEDIFNRGVSEINRYDFEKAQSIFAEIEELDPASPYILQARGLVYERQLNYYDALHEYMSALAFKPEFEPAALGIWRIHTHLGDYEDAAQAAADYARLLPDNPQAKLILAKALINIKQPSRARHVVDEALKLGLPPAIADVTLASAYFIEHKTDSTKIMIERSLSHQNESVSFLNGMADLYESMGKTDSSVAFSHRAVQKSGDNPEIVLMHFHRCLKHNYFFEARQTMARIGTDKRTEIVRYGMELLYNLRHGFLAQSRWAATKFYELSENSLTSIIYNIRGRRVGTDQLSVIDNINHIITMMKRDNYLNEFQEYMYFVFTVRLKDYRIERENLKALEKIGGARSNSREVRLTIADLLKETGQNDRFNDLITMLLEYHSTQADWLSGIADIYNDRALGNYEEAERFYRKALKQDHWYLPAFKNLVKMQVTLNRIQDALKTFGEYDHFEATYPEVALMKAQLLIRDGEIASAVALFENNITYASGNLELSKRFISALVKKECIKEIKTVTELLKRTGTDNPDALTMAAEVQSDRGDFGEALELAERAVNLEPDFIPASVQKARALYWLGNKDEALGIFKANRNKDRNNISNNYYYSRILANEGTDPGRASNIARETLANANNDLKAWMNLSYVYYHVGRFDLSRGEASKAAGSFAEEPEPHFWMGMAMYKEGKPEARDKLEKAIKLGLWGKQLKEARKALSMM